MIKDINFKSLLKKAWADFRYLLSNPVPLSFSKMGSYQTCAYKYKLIYIDRLPGKPSPYLAYGSAMHDTFFEFESLPSGVEREYADLVRIFERNWDKQIGSYRRKWGKGIYELIAAEKNTPAEELEREAYDTGILMLKNYWRESKENPNKVRYVEKWLFGEIGKYHITGRLDRLDQRPDGKYEVIDYKTGQRIAGEETLKDASRGYGLQAGLYYEMCREAWRNRVDRFIFKYLQKRQTFLEYLVYRWTGTVHTAAREALISGSTAFDPPDPANQRTALASAVNTALREKLEEKLLKKVMAEREEERIRGEVRKIRLDEEDEILSKVADPSRPQARLFLKALNKALEAAIAEEINRCLQDPAVAAKYETDVRRVVREILNGLDEGIVGAAVSQFLQDIDSDFRARASASDWPHLKTAAIERMTDEIIEVVHRRDVKEKTAKYLQGLDVDVLAKSAMKILEETPEIRPDRRRPLVQFIADRLRASFSRHLDVYFPEEIARVLSEEAPADVLTADYVARTDSMLDDLVGRAQVKQAGSGRRVPDKALAAARKKIMVLPLAQAIKKIVNLCVDGVIGVIRSDAADELTPAVRKEYLQTAKALSEPQFVQAALQKMSAAYADQLFRDTYFKNGVVPVVDHVTRLFERPDVMKILARIEPGLSENDQKAKAQKLIEKLDWRDVEVLVDEALGPGFAAWRTGIQGILKEGVESAIAAGSTRDGLDRQMEEAAEIFENRLVRVTTLDLEVPYSPEIRENVHRAIEQVQDGIRRNDFTPSRGALCGWCEYQAGCPAWCKYRDLCKDVCKDEYNCKKWFDEKTGLLVEGRPPDMTHDEYLRRIAEKFEVTDKSLFRLSFSKMNSFELCPMNYRKLYLDRISPQPKSFFSIGLSYHQTMEDLFAYTGPRKQPTLKLLIDIFKKKWISAGYRSREEEAFNFRRGIRMCEDYYAEFIDGKYKPAGAAEDYFEFKIGRTLLCGFIDRVDTNADGTISIIDYKTNPKMYTQEELEEDQQMTIYYLAAREGKLSSTDYKPVDVKKFVFQFVNFCKDMETYRKPADLDALRARVTHFTEEMEWRQKTYRDSKLDPRVGMLLFPPQDNKYCQSCDHHHVCPLKTDMTLSGEVRKKGVQFEDVGDDKELLEESADRMATVDAG